MEILFSGEHFYASSTLDACFLESVPMRDQLLSPQKKRTLEIFLIQKIK